MLNVKPIIGLVDDTGLVEVLARVRGKRNSMNKIVDLVDRYIDTDEPVHVMVHYSDDTEVAAVLKAEVDRRFKCAEFHMTPYSPVMVAATGPVTGLSIYA